jgi:outer membrane protein TolC
VYCLRRNCAGLALSVLIVGGCARYRPAPLDPAAHLARYNRRGSADSSLLTYLDTLGAPVHEGWRAASLALTALYYQPGLEVLRAERARAVAAEITAGTREPVGFSADVDRAFSKGDSASPWGIAFAPTFVIETGGKRGARIALARVRIGVAEAAIRAEAWRTVALVRREALDAITADRDLEQARLEFGALDSLQRRLEARFAEGTLPRAELARSAADLQLAQVGIVAAERARAAAFSAVARSAGLTPELLEREGVRPDSSVPSSSCAALNAVPRDSLQRMALESRWDVGLALRRYSEAEALVRIEITRQHPDLVLGPGLFFDHGVARWAVSFLIPSIIRNRNRGPIAEVEANRGAAAAEVSRAQDNVLADLDQALSGCRRSGADLASADSLVAATQRQVELGLQAFERGETSRTDVLFLEAAVARARRTRVAAAQRATSADAELELAVGIWRTGGPPRWPDPVRIPSSDRPPSGRPGATP